MQLKFKWTDELVQEFTREVSKEQNAMFKGCPKLTDKIKAFKRIHTIECIHPINKREYIGGNMIRCTVCNEEFK